MENESNSLRRDKDDKKQPWKNSGGKKNCNALWALKVIRETTLISFLFFITFSIIFAGSNFFRSFNSKKKKEWKKTL